MRISIWSLRIIAAISAGGMPPISRQPAAAALKASPKALAGLTD
jgi:hypothetical protein